MDRISLFLSPTSLSALSLHAYHIIFPRTLTPLSLLLRIFSLSSPAGELVSSIGVRPARCCDYGSSGGAGAAPMAARRLEILREASTRLSGGTVQGAAAAGRGCGSPADQRCEDRVRLAAVGCNCWVWVCGAKRWLDGAPWLVQAAAAKRGHGGRIQSCWVERWLGAAPGASGRCGSKSAMWGQWQCVVAGRRCLVVDTDYFVFLSISRGGRPPLQTAFAGLLQTTISSCE